MILFGDTGGVSVTLIALGACFVILLIVFAAIAGAYNGLVQLRGRYKNAYAQIDVQLKRRYDLIPNLVEVAKGYMNHERETLEAVIRARGAALGANQNASAAPGDPNAMQKVAAAEGALSSSLGRLFAVMEQYPTLKADRQMSALQEELVSTENKIGFARQSYNDAVTVYNTKRELFPTNIVAGIFNFSEAALFEVSDPVEREAVRVKF